MLALRERISFSRSPKLVAIRVMRAPTSLLRYSRRHLPLNRYMVTFPASVPLLLSSKARKRAISEEARQAVEAELVEVFRTCRIAPTQEIESRNLQNPHPDSIPIHRAAMAAASGLRGVGARHAARRGGGALPPPPPPQPLLGVEAEPTQRWNQINAEVNMFTTLWQRKK